jgi:hypothetical protein
MRTFYTFRRPRPLTHPICVNNRWLRRNYYKIRLISKNSNSKFRTYFSDYDIKFGLNQVPIRLLKKILLWCFREILYIIANNCNTFHRYGLTKVSIESPRLLNPVNMESVNLDSMGANQILDNIEKLLQSDRKIFLNDGFKMSIQSSDIPLNINIR